MNNYLLILIFIQFYTNNSFQQINVPIVGFFRQSDRRSELAFRLTIDKINKDKTVLHNITLEPIVEHVSTFDSFNISQRICSLAGEGRVEGILGPFSPDSSGTVNSLSEVMAVPSLYTHWDVSTMPTTFTVNLFPHPKIYSQALVNVIESLDWKSFAVIYEHDEALIRLQEVIKANSRPTKDGHVPFTVWQMADNQDQRPLLKEIQNSNQMHILLDCSLDRIMDFLHQAKEVDLLSDYRSYFLTSLDAHTLDYSELLSTSVNITTLRIVDPGRHLVQAAVHDWIYEELKKSRKLNLSPKTVTTEVALVHDAVTMYANALNALQIGKKFNFSCNQPDSEWPYGFDLANIMKWRDMEGMTGRIILDHETGRRTYFTLDVVEIAPHREYKKIGTWDPIFGMNRTRSKSQIDHETMMAISNMTFRVSSKLGEPYLKERSGKGLKGNARYEGFSMDLIDDIAQQLGFKYEFYIVEDNEYGKFNKETKEWNGLIRELRDRRADLAICDLTITTERRSAVDFSLPFMTLGISILYSKPIKQPKSYFSFLAPFSVEVWMCVVTALLSISLALYIMARISPHEWQYPHPCNPDRGDLECLFSLQNCLWFAIGTLMQQGGDISPKAFSLRIVTGCWGFFVLLIISSYTASLAAFLTTERMEATITSVSDLAKQSRIKYGVVKGGSTSDFFMYSNDSMYQKMWSVMESTRPSVFVKNNNEGVERVLKGKRGYAFFMESTSIEYQKEQHCDLTQVGSTLDSKGYGIAMPFQFPYRTAISGAILNMQETGRLDTLKKKWWKNAMNISCDDPNKKKKDSNKLDMSNAGGVFLVLIVGCLTALFVSIIEFIWNVRKVAVKLKITPIEALQVELISSFTRWGSTKPILRARTCSQDDLIPINYVDHINASRLLD